MPKLFHLVPFAESKGQLTVDGAFNSDGILDLRYSLKKDGVLWPAKSPAPGPRLELWQHTCFELFLKVEGSARYWEWNFSPSGDWALFSFSDYRKQSPELVSPDAGLRALRPSSDGVEVELALESGATELEWARCNRLPLLMGLSAVVESKDGQLSYWALKHPRAEKADFHDERGWVRI